MSDQLRQRMQKWEASPPQGTWTAIAMALTDLQAETALAAKMEQAEITPPTGSKASLMKALQMEEEERAPAPVIHMQPLYPYLLRYGAAAIAIGLVAWVLMGNPFWQKNAGAEAIQAASTNGKANKTIVPKARPSITTAITGNPSLKDSPESIIQEDMEEISTGITDEISNNLPTREPVASKVTDKPLSLKDSPLAVKSPATYTALRKQTDLPVQPRNERYITVMNMSGEPVRLSTKFAPLYYSLFNSAESNMDAASVFMEKMQLQLNRRPFVPDPNNHFDLVQFADLLQKDQ